VTVIVGMWQQHSDQVSENASFVRKLAPATKGKSA
jgi:hypothetical protein